MGIPVLRGLVGKFIDLTANIFGVLPVANGGTGASDITTARTNLGLKSAATYDVGSNEGQLMKVGEFGWGTNATFLKDISIDTDLMRAVEGRTRTYRNEKDTLLGYAYAPCLLLASYDVNISLSIQHDGNGVKIATWVTNEKSVRASYTLAINNKDVNFTSIKSGSASYKKGWRKLSATLPSSAGEITLAHGITTIETIQAKVTDSDGLIVFNNDPDFTRQFYIRVNGANLILGVSSGASKIFGKTVTIYAGEEL